MENKERNKQQKNKEEENDHQAETNHSHMPTATTTTMHSSFTAGKPFCGSGSGDGLRTPQRLANRLSRRTCSSTPGRSGKHTFYGKNATPPSPLTAVFNVLPPMTVYLIRHGESLGQVASARARRNDKRLVDCGLTNQGIWQAQQIPYAIMTDDIELVICSPLKRAIQTAVLAFPNKPILIDYNLREIGSMIPENIPQSMSSTIQQLKCEGHNINNIDYKTQQPENWPMYHDITPKVVRRDHIRHSFQSIARNSTGLQRIAVICHYHVIRSALLNPMACATGNSPRKHPVSSSSSPTTTATTAALNDIRPLNAEPIKCHLDMQTGQLNLAPIVAHIVANRENHDNENDVFMAL